MLFGFFTWAKRCLLQPRGAPETLSALQTALGVARFPSGTFVVSYISTRVSSLRRGLIWVVSYEFRALRQSSHSCISDSRSVRWKWAMISKEHTGCPQQPRQDVFMLLNGQWRCVLTKPPLVHKCLINKKNMSACYSPKGSPCRHSNRASHVPPRSRFGNSLHRKWSSTSPESTVERS